MRVLNNIMRAINRKKETTKTKAKALIMLYDITKNRLKSACIATLSDCKGENFVDSGLKILIAVVIGALLLGGLYALFGQTILPTLTNKVQELFNFKG